MKQPSLGKGHQRQVSELANLLTAVLHVFHNMPFSGMELRLLPAKTKQVELRMLVLLVEYWGISRSPEGACTHAAVFISISSFISYFAISTEDGAGTADAVRQYMWLFDNAVQDGIEDFLILSGDHLYRCNYQDFVRKHRDTGSDITVAALPCDPTRASAFGLMKIDDAGRITSFAEKPTGDALKAMEVDTTVLGLSAEKAEVRTCCWVAR
jgi:hypothetical protein